MVNLDTKKETEKFLQLKGNKKMVQEHVQRTTGKIVTLKDLYNTINTMTNYNTIFFVVRIGSRGYSYNIFNLHIIIIRFSLSIPQYYLL